jgi:glycosyltransferase involved in cell wall biosynthesis
VVLDSGSRDKTCEIAAGLGARVVQHELRNFAEQRNYAASLASGNWVLYLDADERVTSALHQELASAALQLAVSGFWIPTLNYVFGAPLRGGGWYPQPHIRFVQRGKATWVKQVHEVIAVEGSVGWLRSPLLHYGHPNIQTFVRKLNAYTAMEPLPKGQSRYLVAASAVFDPPAYFLYKYVVQRGFRDGWRGLAAALLLSFYRCVRYLKALERMSGQEGAE